MNFCKIKPLLCIFSCVWLFLSLETQASDEYGAEEKAFNLNFVIYKTSIPVKPMAGENEAYLSIMTFNVMSISDNYLERYSAINQFLKNALAKDPNYLMICIQGYPYSDPQAYKALFGGIDMSRNIGKVHHNLRSGMQEHLFLLYPPSVSVTAPYLGSRSMLPLPRGQLLPGKRLTIKGDVINKDIRDMLATNSNIVQFDGAIGTPIFTVYQIDFEELPLLNQNFLDLNIDGSIERAFSNCREPIIVAGSLLFRSYLETDKCTIFHRAQSASAHELKIYEIPLKNIYVKQLN